MPEWAIELDVRDILATAHEAENYLFRLVGWVEPVGRKAHYQELRGTLCKGVVQTAEPLTEIIVIHRAGKVDI